QRLDRVLERLLGQPLEREPVGALEQLAEKPPDPLGAVLGLPQAGQGALDLFDRADADLVPVVEAILEPRQRLVSLLAGGPFVAHAEEDRLEDREPAIAPVGLRLVALFQERVDVRQELRLARCRHEWGGSTW